MTGRVGPRGSALEVGFPSEPSPLLSLPEELIRSILLYVGMGTACGQVCQRLYQMVQPKKTEFYQELFLRDFLPYYPTQNSSLGDYERCKSSFLACSNLAKGRYKLNCVDVDGSAPFVFCANEETLFIGAGSSLLAVSLVTMGKLWKSNSANAGIPFRCLAVSDEWLFSSHANRIKIWNKNTGKFLKGNQFDADISCLVSADGEVVAGHVAAHGVCSLRIWNSKTEQRIQTLQVKESIEKESKDCIVALSKERIFAGVCGSEIHFWDRENKQNAPRYFKKGRAGGIVSMAAFGNGVAVNCSKEGIDWHGSQKLFEVFKKAAKGRSCIASGNGRFYLSSSKGIAVHDVETGWLINTLSSLNARVNSMVVTEGKLIFSAANRIVIYNFMAQDDEIFRSIAVMFRLTDEVMLGEAISRFNRMPQKAIHEIWKQVDKGGNEEAWNLASYEEKAQAIEAYLAREKPKPS